LSAVARTGIARYAYQGRHRSPEPPGTAVRSAALSAGVVAAVMVGTVSTASPVTAAPSSDAWYRLRQCESGNNYQINTGNGYYGAYQFNAGTWRAYGGKGLPHRASPAEQDHRARLLYRARGWAPWPGCARRLGLRENPAYGRTTAPAAGKPKPVTIAGPGTAGLKAKYRIGGRARPHSTVIVKVRAHGSRIWSTYPKRVDSAGRWSMPWRARTDYRYYAVGETRSALRRTRVATTATAKPATATRPAGGRPMVTVAGTARPRAGMVLHVRTPGGRWRTWQKFTAGSSGRWQLTLAAPAATVRFYARSANGVRSPIRTIRL
jgi:hypothetical protein